MKKNTNMHILTDKNFNHQVLESLQPVLVLFCTCWSGSSDIMAVIIEELAFEFSGEIMIGEIDTDKFGQPGKNLSVDCIPTLLFFNNGRVVDRVVGVVSKAELADRLKVLLQD